MTSMASKIPSINMFFEKRTDDIRIYTNDASLYQAILRYARTNNPDFPEKRKNHSFSAWELTGWLIDNYEEYTGYYKDLSTRTTPKHVRIASRLERIKGILDEFIRLGLIQRLGNAKATRGDTTTTLYSFTIFVYILAWIVESFDAKKRDIADQKIYNIMDYHFRDNDPASTDIFNSTLHRKFKEKGVYGEFVVEILRNRINSNAPIWNMTELFGSLLFTQESISNPELYRDLWKETMNQMPNTVKILLLHELKLDIERRMFELVKDVKSYERLRYDLREKYDILAMEAKCEKCHYVFCIEISILEYLEISEPKRYDEASNICPKCKSHNSIIIPTI
jgi:Zn finger protein HypA/HybF involved in hydrogenase expression